MLFIPKYWSWLGETEVGLVVIFPVLVCFFLSNGKQNLLMVFCLGLGGSGGSGGSVGSDGSGWDGGWFL